MPKSGFKKGDVWRPRFQVVDPEDERVVITAAQLGAPPRVYFVRPDGTHTPTVDATPDDDIADAWRGEIEGDKVGDWSCVVGSLAPFKATEVATEYFAPVP